MRAVTFLGLLLLTALAVRVTAAPIEPPPYKPRPVPPVLLTPASAVLLALDDAHALAKAGQDPKHYRYLSSYCATKPGETDLYWRQVSFVTNSLNFKVRALVQPVRVDKGGYLLRVDLHALGIDPKAWDNLGLKGSGQAPFPEPYFHQEIHDGPRKTAVTVKKTRKVWKTWPGGKDANGNYYPAGYRYEEDEEYEETIEGEKKGVGTVLAQAAWLPKVEVLELVALCDSEFPIYRSDWFVTYALQPPAYNVFQGDPKNLKDYQKLAGVDLAAVEKQEGVQLRGVALFSEVASKNRALERTPTPLNYGRGYFLQSYDYFTAIKQDDLLKDLLKQQRDAGELIWATPSGMQGYGLVNGKDERIDFADSRIATDNRTYLHDKTIYNGYKCVFCHSKGTISVADEIRLGVKDLVGLLEPNDKRAKRINDLYFGEDFNTLMLGDGDRYALAVKSVTGLDSAAVALEFQRVCYEYLDQKVGPEEIACETGYPLETVSAVISEQAKVAGDPNTSLDHSFVLMLNKRLARRDHVEVGFATLMPILAALKEKTK